MKAVTISEVAKEAGVSVATVSRAVNGSAAVAPETVDRVKAAIKRLGYQPNVWGRNLRRGESRVALILVPNISNPYYAPIIAGIENAMSPVGYSTMICITNADPDRRRFYLDFLESGRADGAIVMDTVFDDSLTADIAEKFPIVQCCEYCQSNEVSHVSIDNYSAAFNAVSHLAELGHRRIGFVGSENSFVSTIRRRDGYCEALKAKGITVRDEYFVYADGNYSFTSGVKAAKHLLLQEDRPTAVFCISDVLALGALQAARELSLRVPEDISVTGFDDVEYALMYSPKLSTVRQPGYEMGQEAAKILLRSIGGDRHVSVKYLPFELIKRDSTASAVEQK